MNIIWILYVLMIIAALGWALAINYRNEADDYKQKYDELLIVTSEFIRRVSEDNK